MTGMKYDVGYDKLDPAKRSMQAAAASTGDNIAKRFGHGWSEVAWSRGESAYLVETPFGYLAHVDEGLGTKDLSAQYLQLMTSSVDGYACVAQDSAAMILNDLVTTGALPISLSMHLAVGDATWLTDTRRVEALAAGYKKACDITLVSWGPGETPGLKTHVQTIANGSVVLAGSAVGYAPTRGHIINPAHIEDGDLIYLIESSGVHANGITMLRDIALKAPNGYMTKLKDGKTFLEHILTPTHIYAPLIAALQRERVDVHYAINITGHGWRKLMRAPKAFTYYIHTVVPPASPIFSFIQDVGMVRTADMYGDYNMGAGFALVIPKHAKAALEEILLSNAETFGYSGYEAGIAKSDGGKRVVISPLHLTYEAATLQVR